MRRWIFLLVLATSILAVPARAAEVPQDLEDALPREAERLLGDVDVSAKDGFVQGMGNILDRMAHQVGEILRQRLRGAALVLTAVVLCGAVEGFCQGAGGEKVTLFLPMAGALSVTLATAGSLDSLMGAGTRTIEELSEFSNVLLPSLAMATAASGATATAAVQQVGTLFFAGLLMDLIHGLLMPLVYLYVGVLTASAMLPEERLGKLAEGVKKTIAWILTTALLAFTVYLSVVRAISGSADNASLKVAKAAISGAVPVVGSILSEATETVLAGAGLLKNTIGVFGMLGILAACAHPFLHLGIQYLLYKLTAMLSSAVGAPGLCKLIDGLGGAFGLVLGMTGSCAFLLLISILGSVAVAVP